MSFAVYADGSANLPQEMLEGISLLPCEYTVDGEPREYRGDVDHFDGHAYYEDLRRGRKVSTSLLNSQVFISAFTPVLEKGTDIIYISMSSGIGSFSSSSFVYIAIYSNSLVIQCCGLAENHGKNASGKKHVFCNSVAKVMIFCDIAKF